MFLPAHCCEQSQQPKIWLPGVVYIFVNWLCRHILLMETPPGSLDVYCKEHGISFFELRISCIFCRFVCSLVDLAAFYNKRLSLVWKDKVCYACCSACLTLSAKYELENYYQCSLSSDYFEDIVRQPLQEVVIRCLKCLTALDYMEKLDHKRNCKPFHLIRGRWRGDCRNCAQK